MLSDLQDAADSCEHDICRRYGVNVSSIKADSTNRTSIDKIAEYLDKNAISLNTLVFNAAITLRTSFETTTLEDWDRVFFANVHFPVFLLQKIIGHIESAGNVIFTSSLMGIHPHGTSLAYGITKSATHALVSNLVKFLKPYNVRVNSVAPSFVDTDWQKTKPAEIRHNIKKKIALERFCLPQEVAEVYLMLARNEYFNGEIIKIDGGYSYK